MLRKIYFQIIKNDHLPQKICFNCSDSVKSACDIKNKCIETDRLLRKQFKTEPTTYDDFKAEDHEEPSIFCLPVLEDVINAHRQPYQPSTKVESIVKQEISEEEWGDAVGDSTSDEDFSESEDAVYEKKPRKKRKDGLFLPIRSEDYACVFCKKPFKTVKQKREHMQAKHSKEVVCKTCNKQKRSVFAVEKCIKDHQFGFPYLCQVSPKFSLSRLPLIDDVLDLRKRFPHQVPPSTSPRTSTHCESLRLRPLRVPNPLQAVTPRPHS